MRKIIPLLVFAVLPGCVMAQSAVDAYQFSQSDLKGTARFMSMGGAFGALGGDLSSLSVNPAGIGVYRSNDIGFTLNLDCQNANSNTRGDEMSLSQTKFLINNIGGVLTLKLPSKAVPNLNFGFTYNKGVSFNREYGGNFRQLNNSMSNYIAGIANDEETTVADVESTSTFDPYNPNDGFSYEAPWITILGYDSYLISPSGNPDSPHWFGLWGDKTSGSGTYKVKTSGSADDYNIVFGGNISNIVYWGMNFDIVNFNYSMNAYWGENLVDAEVEKPNGDISLSPYNWGLKNTYAVSGTGFNYQLGFIVKPIQELRLGFSFRTPTWYNMKEVFGASTDFEYDGRNMTAYTNNGLLGSNYYNFRSPWHLTASAAGVIGSKFIISLDYEWTGFKTMKFSSDSGYDDWYYPPFYPYDAPTRSYYSDPYYETNQDIKNYYRSTNTFRVGAEYRVIPSFSIRVGWCNVSSPVQPQVKNNREVVYTAGTMPNYTLDQQTNYLTCGLGYRYKKFYADLAYVYKNQKSTYHAYTSDPSHPGNVSPTSDLSFTNNQILLSCGLRF